MSRYCKLSLNLRLCLDVSKAIILILAVDKYKHKLLAALSTAFRVFWSLCAGLLPYVIRTRSSAGGRVTLRSRATRPLKMMRDIVDP